MILITRYIKWKHNIRISYWYIVLLTVFVYDQICSFCALDYANCITNHHSFTLGSKDLSFHLLNQLRSKKIKHVFFIFLFFLTSVITCQTILHNICQFISIHMSVKHYAKNSRCKHENRGCTKIYDEIKSDNII